MSDWLAITHVSCRWGIQRAWKYPNKEIGCCALQMGDTRTWKYPMKGIGCCELQMGDTRTWKYPMKGIGCCELQMGDTRAWKYPNKEIGCCMEHFLQQSEKGRLGGYHSRFKIWRLPACLPACWTSSNSPPPPPQACFPFLLSAASSFTSLVEPGPASHKQDSFTE